MRVLMLSKACIVGIYQRKLEEIAKLGVELLALVPPSWRDERGETMLERAYTDGYQLETLPIAFNGSFHLHYYRGLAAKMRAFRPQIVHIDEEPYNLSTWQALYRARQMGAKALFFSWQNILRRYPLPFSWGERWVLNNVNHALVGTESAGEVWRAKGYRGAMTVIPQFGVDPEMFAPHSQPLSNLERGEVQKPFTIGYFGRLVEEKGIHLILQAALKLAGGSWRLCIVGSGPLKDGIVTLVARSGVGDHVHLREWVPSVQMPAQYHELDVLVLPSLTMPNWKEQFGRVLVEAMASGVPVIGSDSGAIPDVIGEAGLIFPEGDVEAMAAHLRELQSTPELSAMLREKGRARVLAQFTHQQVAAATVAVYEGMMKS